MWILWIISIILTLIPTFAYTGLLVDIYVIASSCVAALLRRTKPRVRDIYLVLGILAIFVAFFAMVQFGRTRHVKSDSELLKTIEIQRKKDH